jgi:hypothetical protein
LGRFGGNGTNGGEEGVTGFVLVCP